MEQTQTQIDIAAPPSLVWAILSDFRTYQRWNPLMRGVLGRPASGANVEIRLSSPPGVDVKVRSTVVRMSEPREIRLRDHFAVPGLFNSERRFRIEALPNGGVRFHHGEQAWGMLVFLFSRRRTLRGRNGLEAMNAALKRRAERACADDAPPTGAWGVRA